MTRTSVTAAARLRITRLPRLGLLGAAGLLLAAGVTLPGTLSADAAGDCSPTKLFVATDGNDKAKGTEQSPFKTVTRARDEIRDKGLNRPGRMKCDIEVNLRAGDYPVGKAIGLDERDSGAGGHKVVYRSVDGPGKARLTGSVPVTGWEAYKDGVYRAKVPVDQPFYTLYDDGQRATNARYPNRKSADEWAPYLKSYLPEPTYEAVHTWLWANPGDWNPDWDMSQGRVTVWSGGSWSWFTDTVDIRDYNMKKSQLTFKYPTRFALHNSGGGSRYFLENSIDFLDQAGEWYADRKGGYLYYKPQGGDIAKAEVRRPVVKTVLDLAGSSQSKRLHDVSFDGLGVTQTDFPDWYRYGWNESGDSGVVHEYPTYDRQIEMPRNRFGAIRLTNTTGIDLSRMHITDTGFTAIYLLTANDHVRVADSLLERLGADGIRVEGPYPGEGDVAHENTFTNLFIDHVGELVPGDASGIELQDTGRNTVSHVVVNHSARYGISLRSRPEVATNGQTYTDGNKISYVRLENTGLDSGDMGAFYTYGLQNDPEDHPIVNSLNQVVIGDVIPDASMPDSGTRGVHMDAGGCGWAISNVQVGKVTDQKYQAYQCNKVTNGDWEDGFDASRMEYDKIGVKDSFPYPKPGTAQD
ncbi:right-handed parallel beta-helix repeat-containing protein [Streptomyces sp. NBC_01016]|uniref:right-handed parallel beta-helix repeat-containing protein n=1 Tax=Streptomyces sp. NBC_01016 TaxID=2903720 RepID=UPI0022574DE4|nr:right-handed parallel beta-helix repeat-containing protein [Streptomyces sp. NBC_01016]MCX4835737.1 right-handed parallel beta-helix repeat-containing protein [Streptomyces sp. NBC_01016]